MSHKLTGNAHILCLSKLVDKKISMMPQNIKYADKK